MNKAAKFIFIFFKKLAIPLRGQDLNRFYLVRLVLNFLFRHFKPKYVVVDGNKIFLDKDDSLRLSILGVYEPLMIKLFKEKIKPGDIVVDVGAHIGYHTLSASKWVGKSGKVYSFEPEKNNFALLSSNVKINNCKNVILVNKAAAEVNKKAELFISPNNEAHHSLVDNGGQERISVEAVSLDEFFGKRSKNIAVVKMDVEGGEYSVVKGMKNILKENRRLTLFTEFSPLALKKAGNSPSGYLNLLKSYGFSIFVIDEKNSVVVPVNIPRLLSSYPPSRDWHVNLLAVKN